MSNTSHDILKKYWGFSEFREKQDVIINDVISNKDTLALLPTGGGKSICFQIPALLSDGICLVISPLISLMQDQVDALKKKGIKALMVNSGMSRREIDITLDNAVYGDYKFLYVSPERLKTDIFLKRFEKMNISFIAVDEAHCISQWGYDFRPAYLNIAELRKIKPELAFLALTATATEKVRDDIQNLLKFKAPNLVQKSFVRKNIVYRTVQTENKLDLLISHSKKIKGSGIIYCGTRKNTKFICKQLREQNISADFYHGGLDKNDRLQKQNSWMNNQTKIIVATNAFGMGIDKSDVRFVLHYDIPETLEHYVQEAGRAGRDQKQALAVLYFNSDDLNRLKEKVDLKFPEIEIIKNVYTAIGNHFQIAIGSGKGERYAINLAEFSTKYNLNLYTTYSALKILESNDLILLNEHDFLPSRLKIIVSNYDLYQYQVKDKMVNTILQFMLRSHMGLFDDYQVIDEIAIARKLKISTHLLSKKLEYLNENKCIDYIPKLKGNHIYFLTERLDNSNFTIRPEVYRIRKQDAHQKLDSMLGFLKNERCRESYILDYFGEHQAKTCGHCNVCLKKQNITSEKSIHIAVKSILKQAFDQKKELKIHSVIQKLDQFQKEEIIDVLRILAEQELLSIDNHADTIRAGQNSNQL